MITLLIVLALSTLALRIVNLYLTREVIMRDDNQPYLVRYFIWKTDKYSRAIYLHQFLASDHDKALHDHPWHFRSFILWGGYYEICNRSLLERVSGNPAMDTAGWDVLLTNDGLSHKNRLIKWHGPLSWLWRPASWQHRVVLAPKGTSVRKCWTIVFRSGKLRQWGFWVDDLKFCPHSQYDTMTGLCHE